MVASICAVSLFLFPSQTPRNIFTPEGLGEAYSAFSQPNSITVRAVYPAIRGEKVERMFATMPLRFAGQTWPLKGQFTQRIIDNFKSPLSVPEPNCVFHPDHLIVFKNSSHTVEAISCFTCDELMVLADGKYLGRVSMGPPKILRTMLTSTVPISETIRAGAEEWLTRELVRGLESGESATVQRFQLPDGSFPARLSELKNSGKTKPLPPTFKRLLLDILEFHSLNNRLSFRHAQPTLTNLSPAPIRIQVSKKPQLDLLFYAAYGRTQLYLDGKKGRFIDLYGIEDRLQKLLIPFIPAN